MSMPTPRSNRPRRWEWIGVVLIAAQIFGVLRMPFVRDRFFTWSPHDQRTDANITATWGGVPVSRSDIAARYGLPPIDWHGAANVDRVIKIAERRTAPDRRWRVTLRTSVNGRPFRERVISIESKTTTPPSESVAAVQP
jgi:hypothetical protein